MLMAMIYHLIKKIVSIDWNDIKADVRKFLKQDRVETLYIWDADFFEKKLHKFKTDA